MSDASIRTTDNITKKREGIVLLQRDGKVVHIIGWTSGLTKRVVRSTSTAELLADEDAVDRLSYFEYLYE